MQCTCSVQAVHMLAHEVHMQCACTSAFSLKCSCRISCSAPTQCIKLSREIRSSTESSSANTVAVEPADGPPCPSCPQCPVSASSPKWSPRRSVRGATPGAAWRSAPLCTTYSASTCAPGLSSGCALAQRTTCGEWVDVIAWGCSLDIHRVAAWTCLEWVSAMICLVSRSHNGSQALSSDSRLFELAACACCTILLYEVRSRPHSSPG